MSRYLEANGFLSSNQLDYKQILWTEDAIANLAENVENAFNHNNTKRNNRTKKVQQDIFLQDLSKLKLSVEAVPLILGYLSNRKQRLRLDNKYLNRILVTSGIP